VYPSGEISSGIVDSGRALKLFLSGVKDQGAKIVDVGCGNGTFLAQLNESGYTNVFGVEAVQYPVLKKFQIKFIDVCFERLPWQGASCDAVTTWEVFEHIDNPRHLAREIHRILKPGGFLFISLPNVFHLMSRLMFLRQGNFPRWTDKNDHWNIFTNQVFKKLFLADFDLVKKTYYIPEIGKGFLHSIVSRLKFLNRYLPEGELFSHFVVYILRKKEL